MNNPNPDTFDLALQTAKSRPAGSLKSATIKHLLKLLGRRPSEVGMQRIQELIDTMPDHEALVYDLICELELSRKPNPALLLLRPRLNEIALSWLSRKPPVGQQLPEAIEWLREEALRIDSASPPNANRFRGVILWLVEQRRNPDFFLACLIALAPLMRKPKGQALRTPPDGGAMGSGFVMARMAKVLAGLARGKKPKPTKLAEIAMPAESVLSHLRDKTAEADAAIRDVQDVKSRAAQQEVLLGEKSTAIQTLQVANQGLEQKVNGLESETKGLRHLHQQALAHAASQIEAARRAAVSSLRSKVQPKLRDAHSYANRPSPAIDQILRLLGEIEQALGIEEAQL